MNDKIPVVCGWLDFDQIQVACLFCGRVHRHGAVQIGSRISHCQKDPKVYEIVLLPGKMPAIFLFLEKQVRKLERRFLNRRVKPDRYVADREQLLLCIHALGAGLLGAEPECVYSFSETIRGLYARKGKK